MAITTTVKNYSKPHGQNGGGGGTTIYRGGSINGSDLPGDLNVTSITAHTGNIDDLTGKTLNYNEGTFLYLYANDGTISKLRGDELNYTEGYIGNFRADDIDASSIKTKDLYADNAWITELNSKYITTEYLTVTKQAHFFELIIDKVRSVGGTLIMTQANSIIDYAKAVDSNGNYLANLDDPNAAAYDVFWLARDKNTGRKVDNDWIVGDQAYCQSFNVHAGVNYDVSNKYYWRLVKAVLADRYMNIRTGAELQESQAAQASVNTVSINTPKISYTINNETIEIDRGWNTVAQTIDGVITGATWNQQSGGSADPTIGVMTTTNTVFGIQMTPVINSDLSNVVSKKFIMDCSYARLNIGIYYTDGSSEFFPAPEVAANHYEYILKQVKDEDLDAYVSTTDAPIEAVVITNADEVEWQLVHGIRLSNDRTNNECDEMLIDSASIPSQGDNIAQLGYRWTGSSDPNEKSRGNAIIIAAYKTPDKGTGVADDLNQYPIKPPSYAQYVAIASDANHRFDLAFYRKTYMDANGSKFRGDFYTGSDQSIVDMIQSGSADLYQLYTAYSHTSNASQAPAQPDGTTWSKTTQGGVSWEYLGTCSKPITIQQGETEEQAIARVEATLVFSDYKWMVVPGGTGTPGGHWENCYKNTQDAINPPNPPNDNGVPITIAQIKAEEDLGHDGWNGWRSAPQALQDGWYTWMSQAFVNGSGTYDLWQRAVRLTGADGRDGEDGNDIEFIYTRNNGDVDGDPLTPAAPPNGSTYRDDWPSTYDGQGHKTSDHDIDSNGVTWYDNPQGVSENMKYEYMCQRLKRNGAWSDYSSPVVWSNWGVKGQDGDGYEYIFKRFANQISSWPSDNTNPAYWPQNNNDEYLGPSGYEWSDDPVGVTENIQYEYVSMRKKISGTWGLFSTPALWAHWAPPGSQGPEGPQGPQGANGLSSTGWILKDNGSKALYGLTLNSNNDIVYDFQIEMKFQVLKTSGDTPQLLTTSAVNAAGLNVYVLMSQSSTATTSKTWYKLTPESSSPSETNFVYSFTPPTTWSNTSKNNFCTNNPYFLVALIPSTADTLARNATAVASLKYQTEVPFLIQAGAQYQAVQRDKDGHASYVNLVTNVDDRFDEVTNNINTITSDIDGITTQVTHLATDVDGLENGLAGVQSTIANQGNQISSMVTEIRNIEASIDVQKSEMIDLTSQSITYYYPVSISLQRNKTDYQRIRVSRWLDSSKFGSKPSWATNNNGFVLDLDWQTIGSGWGTNWDVNHPEKNPRFIINYNLLYTSTTKVAGNITQNPYNIIDENGNSVTGHNGSYDPNRWCDEIVYLKGGSKYLVETDFSDAIIQAYKTSTGYSWSDGQGTTFSAPRITASSFTVNETDTMSKSEIVQTVNSISLNVVETHGVTGEQLSETGIDIAHKEINLKAGKVNFLKTNGDPNPYIVINDAGELIATGNLSSVNDPLMNEIDINARNGSILMRGPNSVDNSGNPTSGATKVDLYKVQFEADSDTGRRVAKQYVYGSDHSLEIDGDKGIYLTEYTNNNKTTEKQRIAIDSDEIWYYASGTLEGHVSWKNIIADHNVYTSTNSSRNFSTLTENGQLVFDMYGIFIYKGTYSATWYLPNPSGYKGKRVVFKSMNGSLTLHSGLNANTWFVEYDSNSAYPSRSIGNRTREYVSDGEHWIELANS